MAEETVLAMNVYVAFVQRSIWWPNVGGVTEVRI